MQTTINRHGNRTDDLPFAAIRMSTLPAARPTFSKRTHRRSPPPQTRKPDGHEKEEKKGEEQIKREKKRNL